MNLGLWTGDCILSFKYQLAVNISAVLIALLFYPACSFLNMKCCFSCEWGRRAQCSPCDVTELFHGKQVFFGQSPLKVDQL